MKLIYLQYKIKVIKNKIIKMMIWQNMDNNKYILIKEVINSKNDDIMKRKEY